MQNAVLRRRAGGADIPTMLAGSLQSSARGVLSLFIEAHVAWLYPISLAVISLVTLLLERLFPWRREQRQLRPALASDFAHLVFNGHFLGVGVYAIAASRLQPAFDVLLLDLGLDGLAFLEIAARWPVWLQIVIALVVVDFLQWCVHNLLHRVSFLWEIHKVHHSVTDGEMDWIVSFRFHWLEVVIYKALLYVPLLPFGFGLEAVMFHAIFGTLIGHLNHANLNLSWGPLRYVFNSPRMHIWHHDFDGDAKTTKNFGIIFSWWDWLFRTAYMPAHPPKRLGFPGVERMPPNLLAHAVWPASDIGGAHARPALLALGVLALVVAAPVVAPALIAWRTAPPPPETGSNTAMAAGASSQPVRVGVRDVLRDPAAAAVALQAFGEDARERGYAHPEHMVSIVELRDAMGGERLIVLDVRPPARFQEGHVPGARPIDRADYSQATPIPGLARPPAELQAFLRGEGVRTDSEIVVMGDGGPEPYRLWWQLRAHGVESRVLDGGLVAWKSAGLPTGAGPPPSARAGDIELKPASVPLTWAGLASFADSAVLLDTRELDEYVGAKQHKDAVRAGHIPGALLLPWQELLRSVSDQRLRSVEDLNRRFATLGIDDDKPVVTYCQTGTRSALVSFALWQSGHDEAQLRNYNGSWAEYSRLPLPLSTDPPG